MADINAIAHGVDTETGEYLSAEERKALFRGKGKMGSKINPQSFRSGTVSATRGGGDGGGALVKFSRRRQTDAGALAKVEEQQEQEFETNEVQNLFQEIKSTFYEVNKVKSDKKRLQSKFLDLLGRSRQTEVPEQEEDPKKKTGMSLGRKARGAATGLFAGIFGILGDLLQFAVLDWISKPENKKTVETFVKIFQGVFKFLDWWVTTAVDNLLSGFAELVGGDSILERIGGFFKLVGGFFMFRWLKNPFKMIKDLGRIGKVLGKFVKIFKSIFKLGDGALKKGLGGALKLAGKAFRVALGRTLKRFLIKLFGKAFTKGALSLGKMLLKRAVGLVRRFPLIGPVIAFGLELAMGEPPGRAAFKAIGATLLGGLGGIIGSIVPGAGTLIGAVIGGLAGEWAGGAMYDLFFKGKEGDKKKEETPGMSTGGIASGPKNGYLVMLHGTEVVIPIARLGDIIAAPFKQLGAGMIGGMMAVINSIGPAANFVKPIIVSVLGPLMKDFGVETFTKTDRVGESEGNAETLGRHIESERKKQDLDKLFGKDLLKDLGSMLMVAGGSVFNSILGGPAQAKGTNPGGDLNASGNETGTNGTVGSYTVSDSYDKGLADLLRNYEGLRLNAYPDPASKGEPYTIGIGATYYPSGFRLRGKVRMGDTITEEEAYWIKQQHIIDHRKRLLGEIGSSVYNKLPDGVKAALESKVFNYGSLREPLVSMVKTASETGNYSNVSRYFRNVLAKHNGGINEWRRNDEANLIDSGTSNRAKISFNNISTGNLNIASQQPSQQVQPQAPSNPLTLPAPSTSATSQASFTPAKPPASSSMVQMSSIFSMNRTVARNTTGGATSIIAMNNTTNSQFNIVQQSLNNTGISGSILLNRI